ncbi:S1C family serine protease [Tumebacillus permanentifrigoris]|uniref:Trypsin-like peptidase n=1 Tax=Tumebacillus permanentifrigoris TaxID=378543 RepID=A0A316DAM5_9BACL|nr:trypsin-like peptidase domain-containing protein [Tumebacillus permanentifrigoris]PWK14378.1 trypsin-like peptidase [Tumebacillus permanentifrigoris]
MKKKAKPQARVTKNVKFTTVKMRRTPDLAAGNIADIFERYRDAVVNIEVVKREKETPRRRDPWGPYREPERESSKNTMNIGTGFIFDARGYIFTNEHVIHEAEQILVRFYDSEDGVPATVVGSNYEMDLAVLKVKPPKNCRVLPFATSNNVRVGEWVVAIGCPLGLDHSVTVGIVSATERPVIIGERQYPQLIQTDAAINRGNSGGPLINMRGQVIGMNTAVSASSQGIGFAIPADVLKEQLGALLGTERKRRKS